MVLLLKRGPCPYLSQTKQEKTSQLCPAGPFLTYSLACGCPFLGILSCGGIPVGCWQHRSHRVIEPPMDHQVLLWQHTFRPVPLEWNSRVVDSVFVRGFCPTDSEIHVSTSTTARHRYMAAVLPPRQVLCSSFAGMACGAFLAAFLAVPCGPTVAGSVGTFTA